jgi:hypothetical protein
VQSQNLSALNACCSAGANMQLFWQGSPGGESVWRTFAYSSSSVGLCPPTERDPNCSFAANFSCAWNLSSSSFSSAVWRRAAAIIFTASAALSKPDLARVGVG